MAGRRARRSGGVRTVLPLRTRPPSNTVSCLYCDFKISALNDHLFSIGQTHARFLRVWFAMGVGLSIVVLIGVIMILILELASLVHMYSGNIVLSNLPVSWVFGVSSQVPGLSTSLSDVGFVICSTLISVVVHEFGHAVAAASQGIQIEYIAIFLAVIFPGALVAFNYEMLQSLPLFNALQILCAGIWHNTVLCAVCWLTLLLLPSILYPIYIYGAGPMVLNVPPVSPLFGYLSHGDVIMSLDGASIHVPEDWMEKMVQVDAQMYQKYNSADSHYSQIQSDSKGYCVPHSLVEESKKIQTNHDEFSCPDELSAFTSIPCSTISMPDEDSSESGRMNTTMNKHCLTAQDVVKLTKCGKGWKRVGTDGDTCACSEDESCLTLVLTPGTSWVEISYSRSYSSECFEFSRNSKDPESSYTGSDCGGTFVYVGDVISVASSIKLSAYKPRWAFGFFGSQVLAMLEKLLVCTCRVSASLALLNSLPVFYLDGESILETGLCYVTLLSPSRRSQILRIFLFGGTLLSIFCLARILLSF